MDQLRRIRYYEEILDRLTDVEEQMDEVLEAFAEAEPLARELDAYYGSEAWQQDLADDEAGLLPPALKRGVLSQDGAWDALTEYRRLWERMRTLAQEAAAE